MFVFLHCVCVCVCLCVSVCVVACVSTVVYNYCLLLRVSVVYTDMPAQWGREAIREGWVCLERRAAKEPRVRL